MTQAYCTFQPTKLEHDELHELKKIIRDTTTRDPLSMAGKFRQLADSAERNEEENLKNRKLRLAVASSILGDLSEQGWLIGLESDEITAQPPSQSLTPGDSVDRIKERIRNGLMVASDRQLAQSSTQDFIRFMERIRDYDGKTVGVKDLVDDGRELSEILKETSHLPIEERGKKLSRVIHPIVQVCGQNDRCEFTGQKLLDVWRYFRHTWSLEYNSVPGRTLRFIIRNKARPNWPVMGIAMLSSPAANMYQRDSWIGWTIDDLTKNVLDGTWKAKSVAQKIMEVLRQSISDIRIDDMATQEEIESGSFEADFRLRQKAIRSESDRREDLRLKSEGKILDFLVDIRDIDKEVQDFSDEDWHNLSNTSLYRKKRSEQLLTLIEKLQFLKKAGFEDEPAAALYETLATKKGREAISFVLNEIRKKALASDVADLSVCGAIAPYNHILGGKLVALLMASQEVRDIYHKRYCEQSSEISSQMAGKRVVRSSELKVLTTTSLYGVGSSQYNRLKLRQGTVSKLFHDLAWEELDQTQGSTVTHLSKRTVNLMRALGDVVHGHRRINSVFGEGSSPRTRQIRQGFVLLGIYHAEFMKQPTGRRVYACELYPGARNELVGFSARRERGRAARLAPIARAWIERWVSRRISNESVLDRIADVHGEKISEDLRLRALRAGIETGQPDLFAGETVGIDSVEQSADALSG